MLSRAQVSGIVAECGGGVYEWMLDVEHGLELDRVMGVICMIITSSAPQF